MPKRVDVNQAEIVAALRKAGAVVVDTHVVGKGCPDLFVFSRMNGWQPIEVKTRYGTPTAAQKKLHLQAPVWMVITAEDALAVCGLLARRR